MFTSKDTMGKERGVSALRIHSDSPKKTETVGEILGQRLRAGDLIFLSGDLGAGKTCLVRGIACGVGVTDGVSSPTYGLVNCYHGLLPLYHLDLYRLQSGEDLEVLGIDEMMEESSVVIIEWGERIIEDYPNHLTIVLEYGEQENQRVLSLHPQGERYVALCEELKQEYADIGD